MNEYRKTHMIVLRTAAVLLILVLATTSMISGRYARYVSSDAMNDNARVAAFVFHVGDVGGYYLDLSEIREPGDSVTYNFTVSNQNGVISEVDEEYVLTMELRGSLPLICSLTGDEKTIALNGKETDGAISTDVKLLEASVQQSISYKLTVTWPADENGVAYSRAGISELVLTVVAQQRD